MCALREFKNIKKSNLDNFIEHENVCSHEDDCGEKYQIHGRYFIENGHVLANAMVYDDVSLGTNICVYDSAQIDCMLSVCNVVHVYSNAQIYGRVGENARLYGCNKIKAYCRLKVSGNVHVDSCARVYSCVEILKNSKVYINAFICAYTKVHEKAKVYDYIKLCNYKDFHNEKKIYAVSYIFPDAKKVSKNDVRETLGKRIALFVLFEIICGLAFISRNMVQVIGMRGEFKQL
ncbi:hypothetical protein [Bartonella raoultii]|uniref:hypothetical protein n=1 Tax=Bartonella raoultii TaxID=1457020 RepID=UPI001ABBB60A|nr:hypothetical protein [Bartonella raoultii]